MHIDFNKNKIAWYYRINNLENGMQFEKSLPPLLKTVTFKHSEFLYIHIAVLLAFHNVCRLLVCYKYLNSSGAFSKISINKAFPSHHCPRVIGNTFHRPCLWASEYSKKFKLVSLNMSIPRGPFYQHGLILIPAWICNHMPSEVWDEITYPFPNFDDATVEVWQWINDFVPHFMMDVITYPCWDKVKPW